MTKQEIIDLFNALGFVPSEQVTLTDAANVQWNFQDGNIAIWDLDDAIAGNRTLTILNPVTPCFGLLKITQSATGGKTIELPSNKQISDDFEISIDAGIVTEVAFHYDGTNFHFSSEIYSAEVENIIWTQLTNAAYSSPGTIQGASASLPMGGTASKKMAVTNGNYAQFQQDSTVANNSGALALCTDNDADYDWGDAANNVIIAVNQFAGDYYIMTGNTNNVATTLAGAAAASDIIRIEKSGNDALVKKSTNNGLTFSTIYTATGVFSGVTDCYIRAMFAVAGLSKIMLNAKGKGLINI